MWQQCGLAFLRWRTRGQQLLGCLKPALQCHMLEQQLLLHTPGSKLLGRAQCQLPAQSAAGQGRFCMRPAHASTASRHDSIMHQTLISRSWSRGTMTNTAGTAGTSARLHASATQPCSARQSCRSLAQTLQRAASRHFSVSSSLWCPAHSW